MKSIILFIILVSIGHPAKFLNRISLFIPEMLLRKPKAQEERS